MISFKEIDDVTVKNNQSCMVYDIEVQDNHHFIANGIITHNCRLKNVITDNEFSFSLGAGGVMAGSTGVITINLNRAIQYALKGYEQEELDSQKEIISDYLSKLLDDVHKFHVGNRRMVEDGIAARLLPVYGKYIRLDKQYCTVGINAVNEAAEFVGCEVNNNKKYLEFISDIFKLIADKNKEAYKKYGIRFNTELIPGESVGPKFAKWDKASKLFSPRECYNSYIYLPESDTTSIPDKFIMHGYVAKSLDGGSALHLNLAGLPDKEFFLWLRTLSAKYGTNYWTTNVKQCACNSCGHIDATTHDKCPVCGSTDIDYITRIIGYAKRISSFSKERQEEESKRYYH